VARAVADLCVNCKMCARECPAAVNVPKMMLEAKAADLALLRLREDLRRYAPEIAAIVN
jgi:Fe-S oxidoreductase